MVKFLKYTVWILGSLLVVTGVYWFLFDIIDHGYGAWALLATLLFVAWFTITYNHFYFQKELVERLKQKLAISEEDNKARIAQIVVLESRDPVIQVEHVHAKVMKVMMPAQAISRKAGQPWMNCVSYNAALETIRAMNPHVEFIPNN